MVVACRGPVPTGDLDGFELGRIEVGDRGLQVALADTPGLRSRGLMGVTDLGEVDGMLFLFAEDTDSGFWMKDTLISLDIAFFDGEGNLVEQMTMEPCVSDPCPLFRPGADYRYALEMPAGTMGTLEPTDTLTIG